MSYQVTIGVAERALEATYGPVALSLADVVVDYPGAAAILLRCALASRAGNLPDSVIVKESRSEQHHLFREWANLSFLNDLHDLPDCLAVRRLVPAIYAGDEDAQVLVIEDVAGPGSRRLGDIVEGNDLVAAEAALLAFNRALARLHVATATADARERFAAHQLRRESGTTSRHRVHTLVDALSELPLLMRSCGVTVSENVEREIGNAIAEVETPGPFLTFTHGDPTPGNVLVTGESIHFVDFETGDYRHALLDGASARIRYLYSVWARRMPIELQRRLMRAYRSELALGIPEAADDTRFNRELMACSVNWLAALVGFLPSVLEADVTYGRSTNRQRVMAGLEHFLDLSDETGQFPALAEAADSLHAILLAEWDAPSCAMRTSNAFADDG